MENTKRELSLDFTKPRIPRGGPPTPSLETQVWNLSTPELKNMISDDLAVLTPNGISSVIPQTNILPSPLIPTTVNNSNNIINNSNGNHNSNNNHHHHHNNNVSNTHQNQNGNGKKSAACDNGVIHKQNIRQDIDLEKIEKKRERNRLAAKKCRQRKLETIDELRKDVTQWEQKYKKLEIEHEQFKNNRNKEIEALRRENADLKSVLRRQ